MVKVKTWDAIIVGGGIAGLSAAIYLGRAQRATLVIDSGKSMAQWEPEVQNYLGFDKGIAGEELLKRGRQQARRYDVQFRQDEIVKAGRRKGAFTLRGKKKSYRSRFLLLATGIFHIPPDINGVGACLGHSMFFCKDCDGVRVRNKRIAVYGANDEAAEYALGNIRCPFIVNQLSALCIAGAGFCKRQPIRRGKGREARWCCLLCFQDFELWLVWEWLIDLRTITEGKRLHVKKLPGDLCSCDT
jgi:alkyl hydroperoxide reductase subunit AhpF